MSVRRIVLGEVTELYSPIGVRPMDGMTGLGPLGKIRVMLDTSDSSAGWRTTGIQAILTPSGVIGYPALERHAEVAAQPPRRYRIRLEADLYRPFYRANSEGLEFDAYPYNDDNPPAVIVSQAQNVFLAPSTNYPFPTHVDVLRGNVVDSIGGAVVDAMVTEGARERVLTDERGAFALPLRWVQRNLPVAINAEDQRTGRTGLITVTIPADLGKNHTITVF